MMWSRPFRYHVAEYISTARYPPYFVTFAAIKGLTVTNLTLLDPPMITIETCGTDSVVFSHLNISASWLTPGEFYDPKARSPARESHIRVIKMVRYLDSIRPRL